MHARVSALEHTQPQRVDSGYNQAAVCTCVGSRGPERTDEAQHAIHDIKGLVGKLLVVHGAQLRRGEPAEPLAKHLRIHAQRRAGHVRRRGDVNALREVPPRLENATAEAVEPRALLRCRVVALERATCTMRRTLSTVPNCTRDVHERGRARPARQAHSDWLASSAACTSTHHSQGCAPVCLRYSSSLRIACAKVGSCIW